MIRCLYHSSNISKLLKVLLMIEKEEVEYVFTTL